jgi:hypothetical protein
MYDYAAASDIFYFFTNLLLIIHTVRVHLETAFHFTQIFMTLHLVGGQAHSTLSFDGH